MPTYAESVQAGLSAPANAQKLADFNDWQQRGMARFNECNQLFRVMCLAENQIWNKGLALRKDALAVDADQLRSLYQAGGYARKWFVFNRPYMFGRERTNDPHEYKKERVRGQDRYVIKQDDAQNPVQARQGGQFILSLKLNETAKARMGAKIVADIHLRASNVDQDILSNSIRVKSEGGTFTLGLPISAVLEVADLLEADDIMTGGRLIPQLSFPTLNTAIVAARQEDADGGGGVAAAVADGGDAAGATQTRSWAQVVGDGL